MENEIIYFCGSYPENFQKIEVESDENYIFLNDPSFKAKILYDKEKNTATVNSFIECEHYVSGGWNYNPIKERELLLQDTTSVIFFILGVVVFYFFGIKKFN